MGKGRKNLGLQDVRKAQQNAIMPAFDHVTKGTGSMFDQTNQEYGIRVKVVSDATSKGPFRADVSCAVTGRRLGGAEGCKDEKTATAKGLQIARRFFL